VPLIAKLAPPTDDPPIACSLGSDSLRGRLGEWQNLLRHAVARHVIDDGLRVEFDGAVPAGELMRLVAAEQDCCQFLRFAITVDTRGIALEVSAPSEARPIVESLFGATA
jgi:MerR family copper efflux transcriptional regulator